MKKFRYLDRDGKTYEVGIKGIDSALPFIQKRFERWMPVETVETEKLKKTVEGIAVDIQRPLQPAEAYKMVETIKGFILQEIDNAEKFYISRKKGE